MNNGHRHSVWSIAQVAAVVLSLAIISAPAQAASPRPLKGGPRAHWTGTWVLADSYLDRQDGTALAFRNGREENDSQYKDMFVAPPKLSPEAIKRTKEYADDVAAGRAPGPRQCGPGSMPRFWSGLYPFEIIQSPEQINVSLETSGQIRRIYLDGRKHPSLDDAEPLLLGHSIGHWEGNDLVVDTVNFDTAATISGPGTNHTEKSHLTERFRPVGADRIDVDVTFVNPDVLAEPYHMVRRLQRKPDMEILDYDCQENNRNPIDAKGQEQVILSPR